MCFNYPTPEEIEEAYDLFETILCKIITYKLDIDGIFLAEDSFVNGVINLIYTTPFLEECFIQKIEQTIKHNAFKGFKKNCPVEVALKFLLTKSGSSFK